MCDELEGFDYIRFSGSISTLDGEGRTSRRVPFGFGLAGREVEEEMIEFIVESRSSCSFQTHPGEIVYGG